MKTLINILLFILCFSKLTFSQNISGWGGLAKTINEERHLNSQIGLGKQNGNFYIEAGLNLYLPTWNYIFIGHGPRLGALLLFDDNKATIQPQIGYHTALLGFIYTGADFTLITNEPKKPIILQPKLGISIFNFASLFYSRGFPISKRESKSKLEQIGFFFVIPIKQDF